MRQKKFPYDAIYKAFFSERLMVRSLLLDFVKLPFIDRIDFSTLKPHKASYATPAFLRRANDLVWRVEMAGRECFLFLMLEFQSSSSKWMAARVATYCCLLLEEVIRSGEAGNGLTPVLPIVIYNGHEKWNARRRLSDLFIPEVRELARYQPDQEYFLLDIRHLDEGLVNAAQGEAGFFVRLERAKNPSQTAEILGQIAMACTGPQYDHFRRLIRNFVLCMSERAEWERDLDQPMPIEEFEMFYDNRPLWAVVDREEGRKEGLQEGRKEGLLAGRKEGLQEGRKEGLLAGRKEERETIYGGLMAQIKARLAERFGELPQAWLEPLASLSDPARIIELAGAAYTSASPEEFEARLMGAIRS